MRVSAALTASALAVAGLVVTGSAVHRGVPSAAPEAPEALSAVVDGGGQNGEVAAAGLSRAVGLLPVAPDSPRTLRAVTPARSPAFAGTVPLHDISLPDTGGPLGIPEIVLAAYRNAELALASSMPGCGLTWNLLAGIGRIESGHAGSGRTDSAGTTLAPIFGPALDGTLPGNEIIKAAAGGYVRAMGPMQFLPSTWSAYAADGNGDGIADPHNVFDASLAAGKYLCSGGMDLRDSAQELRAVLRYNNSVSYARDVLSWSAAYRTGGAPARVEIGPELVPPGSAPMIQSGPELSARDTALPSTPAPTEQSPVATVPSAPAPTQVMITIPGLPPIPCGIFCPPPPPDPCQQGVPAPIPRPGEPGGLPIAQGRTYGGNAGELAEPEFAPAQKGPACVIEIPQHGGPLPYEEPKAEAPMADSEQAPAPASDAAPESEPFVPQSPAPEPDIILPFGIVIPLR
ncbi:lytic transglycosylase domain-containing protein [Nocardia xishanensis]|uniref:lytic transglycosylase domain-containing protein n=1 Tax=Nocardia xishanensis TaxID=238964 RepID=UPI0034145FB3